MTNTSISIERETVDTPESKKELRRRVVELVQGGKCFSLLEEDGRGTGAPGKCLERLLGSRGNNKAMADCVGVEVKYHTLKIGAMLTLNHTEVEGGSEAIRPFLEAHGYMRNGKKTLRHTIRGQSDKFRIVHENDKIIVRPIIGGPEVFWKCNTLMAELISKMKHMILVYGVKSKDGDQRCVRFVKAIELTEIKVDYFLEAICNGDLVIDFDVRQMEPDSFALRNHGTKRRLSLINIDKFWGINRVIAENN